MQVITGDIDSVADPQLRELLQQSLRDIEPHTLSELGYFLVVEPGDSIEEPVLHQVSDRPAQRPGNAFVPQVAAKAVLLRRCSCAAAMTRSPTLSPTLVLTLTRPQYSKQNHRSVPTSAAAVSP